MNNTTITLNVKTPVKLRDVYVIERVTHQDRERLAIKTNLPLGRFDVFHSNVRFIEGSNILATQTFEEIMAKADRRFIAVRIDKLDKSRNQITQIVPIDAIRHFEFLNKTDQQAIKTRYPDTDPVRIDALKTRIVYFGLDHKSVEAARPTPFRKIFPIDLRADIKGIQKLDLIALGHGRMVLADEIVDAVNLSEAELQSLSRKYNLRSGTDGPLTTSVKLRGGDLIMSSLPADELAKKIKRSLPSVSPQPALVAALR
ncbi:MAG: hypothetical protein SGJ17_06460 [Hyphomicrobiales bacterium]|nr:hypothetical protein [Hyphomicrobiales bacterium]